MRKSSIDQIFLRLFLTFVCQQYFSDVAIFRVKKKGAG
ncbi:hypothetical protein IL54_0437 [Sphingobium sp. ba1]|nr:hypothetical protein IL54_0437 [Sphingobium sp. ba1]